MSTSLRMYRSTWFTEALGTAKMGMALGLLRFPIEYWIGKFPSVVNVLGVHLLYLFLKYATIKVYGLMGDRVDFHFPRQKTVLPLRMFLHGVVLSVHIIPLYVISCLVWGIRFDQMVPGITWYAVTNTLTGLATRALTLRERRKRFHRKNRTP
jgi:hypothetical protein